MTGRFRKWLHSRVGKALHRRWTEIRESIRWSFVHPWERRYVEEKLAQGWETWTDEDARYLSQLIIEVGQRMMDRLRRGGH